jgi:hypothetical protein
MEDFGKFFETIRYRCKIVDKFSDILKARICDI